MINVIICEDKDIFMNKNILCVNKAFANTDVEYKIHKFNKSSSELDDLINNDEIEKLYILDVEMDNISGLELAAKIRETDFKSIIIFATAYDKYRDDVFYTRLMVLDFVCKYNGYEKRLIDDIEAAIKIMFNQEVFSFKYNHVMYRVRINDILYIEKEPIIKRCIIHTKDRDYYIVKTIDALLEDLGRNFVQSHQSCIVNCLNVKEIDCANNNIIFKDDISTNLLSSKYKKDVIERVKCN